ncbi:FAD-dependent pyridine nucleotide-disulfide oxidoreductase [Gordonia neofelifaecis NRRL B-59395]|uniref:FAD-dependent pyridine nucleotide-disulfide oxidoreductase n=1 Tax=Gordonia neofelifaecis NRRL B-59395 TaxID=644548 RepID=F1YEE9_9ACTN|nr:FAD-dependent pyridine nucleotide-disulfide oxidoreductase [Gordonia neofelifaecis NRRL B-59395]
MGAGYAGTMAANRLARRARGADVTVVNPRPEFVERIRLHQVIAGSGDAARPLTDMLDDAVHLRVTAVEKIGDGSVALNDGGELGYDRLIYATGGAPSAPDGAIDVGDLASARSAAGRVAALSVGARVTVVGGGLTGIETASEVAAARPDLRVRLVSDGEIGRSLGPAARERVVETLTDAGVEIENRRWSGDAEDDLTLWALANKATDLAVRSGIEVDPNGRILVDEFLRSTSDPRILAVGDGAAVPGSRMSCQAALPQGSHAADVIAAEWHDRAPEPYAVSFVAQCVSLGRRNGVVQHVRRDDTPTRVWMRGRPAAAVKEQICRGTVYSSRSGRSTWKPGRP